MPMRYQPLDAGRDEIRLLEIMRTKDRETLHLRLRYFPLDKAPRFVALSYTWGESTKRFRIVVDGHNFQVTENLFNVLRDRQEVIRLGRRVKNMKKIPEYQIPYIWADAICINQLDSVERAQQVLRMPQIYQAGLVCIHLKIEFEAGLTVIQTIEALDYRKEEFDTALSTESWLSVSQLFSQPWFRRVWVIQEFVMARSPWIFAGSLPLQPIPLIHLAVEILLRDDIPLPTNERVTMFRGIKQFLSMSEIRINESRLNSAHILTALLWSFRDCEATDPRDKVYSLLGMFKAFNIKIEAISPPSADTAAPLDLNQIIINYQAPIEEVYANNVYAFSDGGIQSTPRYRASGSKVSSVSFSDAPPSITVEGILWCHILHMSKVPPLEANQLLLDSMVDLYSNLDEDLRARLKHIYGKIAQEEDTKDPVINEWVKALLGGDHIPDRCGYRNWRCFHPGATKEWHELAYGLEEISATNQDDLEESEDDKVWITASARIAQLGEGRRVFVSESGYCGLVPEDAEDGDCLCVLFGCDAPVVLRKTEDWYKFIGECYIQRLMNGEAIKDLVAGKKMAQEFEIR
ncbi:hypothetical protein LTR96_008808 [Exophiala xenobiotica]|nr:hypothetical protein LTR96_008808 [Exophiala xenobiotica]KAK5536362.1 hypothetical protein LTR23_007940 [Chaetothyriales sp. CCFEE 6169]